MDQPRDQQNGTDHLVVIGASAGGIEALQTLAASLPPGFPAPIVVAQHLSPSRESALREILAKASTLRVRSITDRERLEPGTIYVVPSNSYVEIIDRDIVVRLDHGQTPLPSIDLLFTTAASAFGEGTIGVVLTGTGTDGAAGARDIKAAGGTIVIQNPETASFPSLPLAMPPTIVDVVADLETISARLVDLLSGDQPRQTPEEDAQLRSLLTHLRERTGIDFNAYKPPTIRRRLQRRMTANGVSKLAEYIEFLKLNPDEYPRLANAFLIKVTEFFRDPDLFDHLREQVLPDVLHTAREHGELRIWSAGCATGEEAYSLAMLVAEELTEADRGVSVRVFATDLDADAVAFARRGIFPASALASMPTEMVERYFVRADHAYEVKKEIRSMVVFGQHDLAQRAPFPRIDIALCRNVLIYFTAELQKRALHLFAFSLRDDGYLILGKAESVHPLPEFFTPDHPRLRIYRRIGGRIPVPVGQVRGATTVAASPSSSIRPVAGLSPHIRRLTAEEPSRSAAACTDAILARLPVGVVVVDRKYDVQSINAAGRRLLGVYGPALGEDLIHQTRHVPANVLRTVVDAAFRGELTTSLFDVAADVTATGEPMALELVSYPESSQQPDEAIEAATIIITDVTLYKTERYTREERDSQIERELARLNQRVQQLTHANRVLLDANEELAAINAETRIANEVLLVGSEEIQSATEEVETLNEELQATNEELETLNEELQATVEELNTTNDDLQARSLELQALAVSLESQRIESDAERERVQAILNNMGDAVLVVDRNAEPLMMNAAFRTMFGDKGQRFKPRVGSSILTGDQALQLRVARGEVFTVEFTILADVSGERSQRWFEATGQPVEQGRGEQNGVIVIRDITDRSLRRMQDEFLAIASHELRSPLTTLSGSIQLLQRVLRQHEDERVRRYVEAARSQAHRLSRLIEDLVDAVRLQTGRFELVFEEFDLIELARGCVSAAQSGSPELPIELDAPDDTIMIVGDQVRIEQVLMILLSNAIAHARGTERIDVRVRRLDDHVEMQVQDYGVGIASGDHERIFSRFSQIELVKNTRQTEAGLGLGLFISRTIALSHGGTIEVESAPGEGATFTVVLPVRQKDDGSA